MNNPRWKPDENTNKFIDNLSHFLDKNAAELIESKRSKRSSLILSRLSLALEDKASDESDEEDGGDMKGQKDNLYIKSMRNEEDKKERIASSIISMLDNQF